MDINLVRFRKDGSEKIFALPSSVTVIGRRHDCDLCIPIASVSKRHCQLNIDDGVLKIRDLGSRNGTYLNDEPIENETVVEAGNSIRIGPLTFVLQIDGKPETVIPPEPVIAEPKEETPKEAVTDEQFSSLAELEDIETLEEAEDTADEQFDDLSGLDDLDSLEELEDI